MERAPGPTMQQAGEEPARAAIVSFACVCESVCLSIAGVKLNHTGSEHGPIRNEVEERNAVLASQKLLLLYSALLTLEEKLSFTFYHPCLFDYLLISFFLFCFFY